MQEHEKHFLLSDGDPTLLEHLYAFTHSSATDQVVLVCGGTGESEDSQGWFGSPNNLMAQCEGSSWDSWLPFSRPHCS